MTDRLELSVIITSADIARLLGATTRAANDLHDAIQVVSGRKVAPRPRALTIVDEYGLRWDWPLAMGVLR